MTIALYITYIEYSTFNFIKKVVYAIQTLKHYRTYLYIAKYDTGEIIKINASDKTHET